MIHVDGIRNDKGVIGVAIFNKPDGWPEKQRQVFSPRTFPFTGNSGTITFSDLPPGDYAIVAVIHDENKNHKLDAISLDGRWRASALPTIPRSSVGGSSLQVNALSHVTCPARNVSIHLIYK